MRLRLSAVLIVGWLILLGNGCGVFGPKPLEFWVTFEEINGLQSGDPVLYNGVTIGIVREVTLDEGNAIVAVVEIAPQHRERVYREADFVVEKPSIFDFSGARQLTMKDGNQSLRTPILPEDIIVGSEGWLDRVGGTAADFGHWVSGRAAGILDNGKKWSESPEGRAFLEQVRVFAENAREATEESWETFWADQYPELRRRAVVLIEHLEEVGKSDEARELRESLERFEKSLGEEETGQDQGD